ncbi:MAG: hypothetical protein U5N26_08050 [Candidatus Marinimicrobia bacterium]|nr:hypothetical protein [Candidatus Neomarinimicrobiota bacterium]
MYDWANSAFATTVMAGFFPIFSQLLVREYRQCRYHGPAGLCQFHRFADRRPAGSLPRGHCR